MKTLTLFKHKQPCVNISSPFVWPLQWSLLQSFIAAAKKSFNRIALVCKEALAGLPVIIQAVALATRSNTRVYIGLWFLLVVAPLAAIGYQLFPNDKASMDFTWYHVNYFHLFMILCPHISLLLSVTGIFLIMPTSRRSYFLVVPAAYHTAKILWLISVSSNNEFYQIIPSSFFILGALLAFIWLFTFDWLMTLHFHKREGTNARIHGIIALYDSKEIPSDVALSALVKEHKAMEQLNQN